MFSTKLTQRHPMVDARFVVMLHTSDCVCLFFSGAESTRFNAAVILILLKLKFCAPLRSPLHTRLQRHSASMWHVRFHVACAPATFDRNKVISRVMCAALTATARVLREETH